MFDQKLITKYIKIWSSKAWVYSIKWSKEIMRWSTKVWELSIEGLVSSKILTLSCRIFGSFCNPRKKLEFMLYPPLSYLDHLVSQAKITIMAPSLIIDLGLGQTGSAVLSMSTSKCHLVPKYVCILQISTVWESQAFVKSKIIVKIS